MILYAVQTKSDSEVNVHETKVFIKHKESGKVICITQDTKSRFKEACKSIKNYVKVNYLPISGYHMVLTVRKNVSEVDWKDVNRVMSFIRGRYNRNYTEMKYILVREYQKRGAIHFHCLIFAELPNLFPEIEMLERSWGLGYVFIRKLRSFKNVDQLFAYMMKYVGKAADATDIAKFYTMSRIPDMYKLSWDRLKDVMEFVPEYMFPDVKVRFRKVYIDTMNGRELIKEFPTDWEFLYKEVHNNGNQSVEAESGGYQEKHRKAEITNRGSQVEKGS